MPHSGQKGSLCDCGGGGPQALLQAPHTDSLLLVMWGLAPPLIPSGPWRALGGGDRPYDPASGLEKRRSYPSTAPSAAEAPAGGRGEFQQSLSRNPSLFCYYKPRGSPPHHTDFSRSCAGFRHLTSGQIECVLKLGSKLRLTCGHRQARPALQVFLWPDMLDRVHCASPTWHLPQSSALSSTSDEVSQTGHVQNSRSPQEMELESV